MGLRRSNLASLSLRGQLLVGIGFSTVETEIITRLCADNPYITIGPLIRFATAQLRMTIL